jgi:hypothetical protein
LTSKGGSSNHNEVKPVGKVEEKKNQG